MSWRKSMVPGLLKEKNPSKSLSNNAWPKAHHADHRSQGSFEELVHGYVNKMKLDNKRTGLMS
jgi:hypothetical protein